MIKVAGQAAEKPDASTLPQAEQWGDLKATYRLFDQNEVTFEAITARSSSVTGPRLLVQTVVEEELVSVA